MPRKRLIAPEFFTHEALYETEASLGLPLRIAFAGLWTQADRRGIFRWRPKQLKLAVLPYDEVDFEAVLEALLTAGFLKRYEVGGESYGIIPSFARWQTFHHAERASDAPEPGASLGLTPSSPRSNPTVTVTVTDTIAVTGTVERLAGPEGPPPPALPARGGQPVALGEVDWRAALSANGARPPLQPFERQPAKRGHKP